MNEITNCPKCGSEYVYFDGALYVCPDCGHEFDAENAEPAAELCQRNFIVRLGLQHSQQPPFQLPLPHGGFLRMADFVHKQPSFCLASILSDFAKICNFPQALLL